MIVGSESVFTASQTWKKAMEKVKGPDWVGGAEFNCSPDRFDDVASKAFKDVRISIITIGWDIRTPKC